jgi:hypothetical protein
MSLNRWVYVEGNPVNYLDPSGNSVSCGRWQPGCGDLAQMIEELVREVFNRASAIRDNIQNLPMRGEWSVESHQNTWLSKQNRLKKFLDDYRSRCGPPNQTWKEAAELVMPWPKNSVDTNKYLPVSTCSFGVKQVIVQERFSFNFNWGFELPPLTPQQISNLAIGAVALGLILSPKGGSGLFGNRNNLE